MKLFDYDCPAGHTVEHDFGHLDTIPDQLPCSVCAAAHPAGPPVMADKVKVYRMVGVRLPTGPATYSQD